MNIWICVCERERERIIKTVYFLKLGIFIKEEQSPVAGHLLSSLSVFWPPPRVSIRPCPSSMRLFYAVGLPESPLVALSHPQGNADWPCSWRLHPVPLQSSSGERPHLKPSEHCKLLLHLEGTTGSDSASSLFCSRIGGVSRARRLGFSFDQSS